MILLRIVRYGFFGGALFVVALAVLGGGRQSDQALNPAWSVIVAVAGIIAVAVVAIDVFTPRKKIATLASVFFGLLLALLATLVLGYVIDQLSKRWELDENLMGTVNVLVGIGLAYLGVVTVLQTQDDFRLVIPYVEFAKQLRGQRPMILDSSVLIDARIVEIGETGLIQAPVVIPGFVVAELQTLADSGDRLKRSRGRRGLDIIAKVQRSAKLDVSIDETPVPGKAVDQMLIELARTMPGMIVTTDLGLTRVARIQDVEVLNLHDLASALRPSVIPGEELTIELVRIGEQPTQGVGYLDDGTMVVAENGAEYIGRRVTTIVTSSLQTSAGRLIFTRVRDDHAEPAPAEAKGNDAKSADAKGTDASPPEPERKPADPALPPPAEPTIQGPRKVSPPPPEHPEPPRRARPGSSPRNPRR